MDMNSSTMKKKYAAFNQPLNLDAKKDAQCKNELVKLQLDQ